MNTRIKVPFFTRNDIGGITYIITNNIVNYLIVIATLSGVLDWPDEIVFGRVIPGLSIGLLLSCIYYAFMAWKLAQKTGNPNVTALPSGVSTPAMFVILYGVIMPLHYAIGDPYMTWSAAMAACFIGGMVEFAGGIIGPWMKRHIPRAALLGTVAGIGFIWMATQGVFDILSDPIVGIPILIVAVVGLFGGYLFPKKIPPLVVAVVGGIIYALAIGRTSIDFSGVGFYIPNPVSTIEYLISGFAIVAPYLTIIIPIEIYNFIETMDNVEAANAAGDDYSVREAQFADGVCTMISALLGGVVPNTVWLGHAGLKKSGAGVGYSVVSGLILGIAGILGLFTFFSTIVPPAIAGITYLWCATLMVAQAFRDVDKKYHAAVGVAMVPPVADFLFTQVTGAIGVSGVHTELIEHNLMGFNPELSQAIIDMGVLWRGIPETKHGAIIIGIIFGSFIAFIIDRKLNVAALTLLAAAVFSVFGLIHSASLGFFPTTPFAIAYAIGAAILYIMHLGRNTWCKAQDNFDYL